MKSKIKIAVVGLRFGAAFAPIYRDHPDVAEVAICDMNEAVLRDVGNSSGIARRFADFNDVLAAKDIDAVHLLTGIPDHAKQSIDAMNAGKHCACAIPMATSIADIKAIIAAKKQTGKSYMMMETHVYTRQFLFAKELVARGEFGRIQFLRGWHYQDMEGWVPYWAGLPPMWYAQHALAPLLAIAQARAVKVHCMGSGEMRKELHRQYGNPYPIESALFQLAVPGLCAEVTRSLFQCAYPGLDFIIYGDLASFDGQLHRQHPHVPGEFGRRLATERPELPDRTDLLPPSIARYTQSGMDGCFPHLVHEFMRSIMEERASAIDAVTSADWTAAGICAHESAMAGGREVVIPEF